MKGRGCGSVGRALAFVTKDLRFESGHMQFLFTFNWNEKTKIKEKEARICYFLKM